MEYGPALLPVVAAPFVGSFLATAALRLPAGRPIAAGRSACPACGHALSALSLVPVASWLAQRARCRHCAAPISAYYPAVELTALAVAGWAALVVNGVVLLLSCALGWTLLTLAVIDLRERLLPDRLTLPLAAAGFAATALVSPSALWGHALAAAAGFAAAWLVAEGYRVLRGRVGLGFGDVKLIAAAGAWVGADGLPGVVLIATAAALLAALLAALVAVAGGARPRLTADLRIPFGPFLALGLWVTWLHGPLLLRGLP